MASLGLPDPSSSTSLLKPLPKRRSRFPGWGGVAGVFTLIIVAMAVVALRKTVPTPTPSSTTRYRSILGDSGMRWSAQKGPRMQLFFYNLCSKAGDANNSVIPASTDTCERNDATFGVGEVECVNAEDCCAACLARPWCLSWSEPSPGRCSLKDNVRPAPPGPSSKPPTPSDFTPRPGICGSTTWDASAESCREKQTCSVIAQGAIRASRNSIRSLKDCEGFCRACPQCAFVSFSAEHDDCSWYTECDLSALEPVDGANYLSVRVRARNGTSGPGGSTAAGGRRKVNPEQRLPSPRYANCVVDGKQVVLPEDNAAQVSDESGVDVEWFAVEKEHHLAAKCAVPPPPPPPNSTTTMMPSFFWTVMSQNGNAPARLGSEAACMPQCYDDKLKWPPAVNASSSRCPEAPPSSPPRRRRLFNNLPMNQGKVLVGYTDPSDPKLGGSFNWTFELDSDLSVSEADFPMSKSLGVWEWFVDKATQKGVVRVYQRVSREYSWICTYFGADTGMGVKANQAYDGRGIMTEKAVATLKGPVVRFWLNVTKYSKGSMSWYAPNMEACWDQKTRKPCTPYGDTNAMVHNQVLLDYGPGSCGSAADPGGCPRYHRWPVSLRNSLAFYHCAIRWLVMLHVFRHHAHTSHRRDGSLVHRSDPSFPYGAYKQYCGPCDSCEEMEAGEPCCDPFSNSNGQSIYKIRPHEEWAHWGFPRNASDGFVGDPKMHVLNVGGLFSQIWFPCMTDEPIEIVSVNIGPETSYGTGTHDTEFFVSDFDILMPENGITDEMHT